jgi:hypothetical protein
MSSQDGCLEDGNDDILLHRAPRVLLRPTSTQTVVQQAEAPSVSLQVPILPARPGHFLVSAGNGQRKRP